MGLIQIFNINKNIIQIYNNQNIELFYQDSINIALKTNQYILQPKYYHLVFKTAILNFKSYFLFSILIDFYLIIDIYLIKLDKLLIIT